MNVQVFAEPWTYAIADDFFSFEENHIIKNYTRLKFANAPQFHDVHKLIMRHDLIMRHYSEIESHDLAIWNYCNNIARSKFPILCEHLKVPKIDYELWVEFSCFNADCPRGIHVDRPEKYISCLVYLDGKGAGTWLYSEQEVCKQKIDFRHNRALIFHNTSDKLHAVGKNVLGDNRTAVNFIFAHPSR